jgi:hypothetical protein
MVAGRKSPDSENRWKKLPDRSSLFFYSRIVLADDRADKQKFRVPQQETAIAIIDLL